MLEKCNIFHSMLSGQFLTRQFPNYGAWGTCARVSFELSFYGRSINYLSTSIINPFYLYVVPVVFELSCIAVHCTVCLHYDVSFPALCGGLLMKTFQCICWFLLMHNMTKIAIEYYIVAKFHTLLHLRNCSLCNVGSSSRLFFIWKFHKLCILLECLGTYLGLRCKN